MTSRAGKNSNNGFTLIEILIGLVLIGLIMGLVIGQAGKMFERNMKQSANRLASTIRYLYNKSISEGLTLRLVLDVEESKYWVESTSEHLTLTREEEETKPEIKKEEKEEEKGETTDAGSLQSKKASFSPEASYLLKPVQLPKSVYFKDIYAEHQIERLNQGRAYIYFFPRGYVERSVINLRDSDDEVHYSLEINPISGEVSINREYKEPEIER